MKLGGSVILLSALAVFCTGAVAFGQAPSPGLGTDEAVGDQQALAAEPVAAQGGKSDLQPRGQPSGTAVPRSSQGNPLWAIPLESLHMARERPLFSPSRRPPLPIVAEAPKISDPTPPQPAATPETPQVTLVGVVRGPRIEMGVFVDETDKSLLRLRVGESVRGWIVHGVNPRAATLEKAEQQVKLELPTRDTETAAATSPATEEAASAPPGPSGPIHGTPVGRIKPFATAGRFK
jgi:general secretion pathway protein N